mgnify:CR=1 FL=1
MKLLREFRNFEYDKTLLERSRKDGRFIMRGIFSEADKLNQNNRIYKREYLEREVNNFQKLIREKRAYGEIDHPESSVISLDRACLVVRELFMRDDGVVIGECEILNTEPGKKIQAIVNAGYNIGISSRSVGTTETSPEGHEMVASDLSLLAFDAVSDPSVGSAILMKENKNLTPQEIKNLMSRSDRINRILNEILN